MLMRLFVLLLIVATVAGCTRTRWRLPHEALLIERAYSSLVWDGAAVVLGPDSLEVNDRTWPLVIHADTPGDTKICVDVAAKACLTVDALRAHAAP